jgi:hypothetical protein
VCLRTLSSPLPALRKSASAATAAFQTAKLRLQDDADRLLQDDSSTQTAWNKTRSVSSAARRCRKLPSRCPQVAEIKICIRQGWREEHRVVADRGHLPTNCRNCRGSGLGLLHLGHPGQFDWQGVQFVASGQRYRPYHGRK